MKFNMAGLAMSYKIENSKYESSTKKVSVIKKRISFRKLAIKHRRLGTRPYEFHALLLIG